MQSNDVICFIKLHSFSIKRLKKHWLVWFCQNNLNVTCIKWWRLPYFSHITCWRTWNKTGIFYSVYSGMKRFKLLLYFVKGLGYIVPFISNWEIFGVRGNDVLLNALLVSVFLLKVSCDIKPACFKVSLLMSISSLL